MPHFTTLAVFLHCPKRLWPSPLSTMLKKQQDSQSGASLTYSNIYVLILIARTLSKSPNISFASSTIAALTESAWKTCRTKSSALPLCQCCQDWSLNCEIVDRGGGSLNDLSITWGGVARPNDSIMIRLLHGGCLLWPLKSNKVIYGPPLIVAIIVVVAIALLPQ